MLNVMIGLAIIWLATVGIIVGMQTSNNQAMAGGASVEAVAPSTA